MWALFLGRYSFRLPAGKNSMMSLMDLPPRNKNVERFNDSWLRTHAFGTKSHYSIILFMMFRIVVYPLHCKCPYIWQCSRGKVLSGCESHTTGYCSALLGSLALETSRPPALLSDLPAGHICTTPPFQSDPKSTQMYFSLTRRWSVK